jgi:hypothetical protein
VLAVIVDTEEEFPWDRPLARAQRAVTNVSAQARAQTIFADHGIVPTYVVDDPVARDPEAAAFLRGLRERGACEIGAHCHPWVNPPHAEPVTPANSYPGNLPRDLERRKLAALTATVADAVGARPRVYKAGRYGLGPNTPAILRDLGYAVDASVVPYTSFAADGGPDFRGCAPYPTALAGAPEILELPLTVGFTGALRRGGTATYQRLRAPLPARLRLPGILARARMFERIRLSPEGARYADHRRLTRCLLADGLRVFTYTYHSPSLAPGNTPYVRTTRDLAAFEDDMRRYFAHFLGALNGIAATPTELHALWRAGVALHSVPASAAAR